MTETLPTLLTALHAVLDEERAALVRFDSHGVELAADKKAELAGRLQQALADADRQPARERSDLLRALSKIRWAAEANRALLADAADMLASVRVVPTANKGTYDRRACIHRAAPTAAPTPALGRTGT